MTSENKWTPEVIRALGPTTDLPTLGAIFECSRWKAYQMAREGEWGRLGIKVLPIGSKYRVVVQSILEVLGYSCGDVGTQEVPGRVEPIPTSEETDGTLPEDRPGCSPPGQSDEPGRFPLRLRQQHPGQPSRAKP